MGIAIIESVQPADEHYRALFATMAQGVVYQDPDGRVVSANPAAERILGRTLDQLRAGTHIASPPGENPDRMVIREDGSAFPHDAYPTALALRTGRDVRDVVMGVYHSGEDAYRWISVDAAPLFVPGDDKPRLVYAIFDDITARRAAEQERTELLARERATATRLRAVLDVLPVGVIIADARGALVQANEAAHALWGGLSMAEGVEAYGVYRGWWPASGRPLAPEEWAMARALRTGEFCAGEEVLIETFDGARKTMLNSAAPIRDDAGAIAGAVVAMIDITARKRLERRTQETLDALLAMAQALVAPPGDITAAPPAPAAPATPSTTRVVARQLLDVTRSVLDCQRVSITAYDAATGMSHPVAVVGVTTGEEQAWRSGQPGTALREYLDAAQQERLVADDVLVVSSRDAPGRRLPYGVETLLLALMRVGHDVVGVLSLDHGAVAHAYTLDELALARAVAKLGGLVIERDRVLREREEARANEAALREANRRMDTFVGIAGHEMRTPLTTIKGTIQVARRRLARLAERDGAVGAGIVGELREAQQLLGRTDSQVSRLNRLVEDVLDASRIRADHLEISVEPSDLAAIVREVVAEQREIAADRAIGLEGVVGRDAGNGVPVTVDPGRIAQVLTNYLANALRYSPPHRPVTVGLDRAGATARVWVRDEGPGLSPDEQGRIWDRFYRVSGVGHQYGSSMGLGLGLYISRTIIEAHGGRVGVESVPGAGATFWFTIPLHMQGDE